MLDITIDHYHHNKIRQLLLDNLSEFEAEKAFRESVINKMLKRSPEFIMHYSIQTNAKEVYDEYMGIPLEM